MKGRALIQDLKAQAVEGHCIPEVAALIAEKLIKEGLVKPRKTLPTIAESSQPPG